jgi:hypothetical protein
MANVTFSSLAPAQHTADQDGSNTISLSELLRVIQFFNHGALSCDPVGASEDGYLPGSAGDQGCGNHSSDYVPADWIINISEVLRLVQFFNSGGFHAECGTEDGYAPGPGVDTPCVGGGLLWSDPATWGGAVPAAGEDVMIDGDMHVILDVNSAALGDLMINGTLEFTRQDVSLTADFILVHGLLEVGTESEPFTQQATITLTGDDPGDDTTRGIMVMMGGALELHGAPPAVAWTKLNAHANAAATSLQLMEPVDWQAGDQILVAPTDWYGASSTERVNLSAVAGDTLTLATPLAEFHWGRLQYATNSGMSLDPIDLVEPSLPETPLILDERAEVGHLTRNIVIQAPNDALWQDDGIGVHVMIMVNSSAHVDGVEIRRGGRRSTLGRYPFHWHRLSYNSSDFIGDATGQYLRNSVINESSNRGIVIHATNGLSVENNIIYDVRGHGIFTEDAVERRNTIANNLILRVRNPQVALKGHEVFENGGSSGLWLANPDNTVTGNAAADCQGFGFWLAFPDNPWGDSIGVDMRPSRVEFGVFENNTAHTSGFEGIMFDFVEVTNGGAVAPFQYISTIDENDPTWNSGTARRFALTGLSAWKNRRGGLWDRVYWPDITGFVSADNCGRFFAGSGADGVIERCLIVGTSLNNATPRPSVNFPDTLGGDETPAAFATYHSSFDMRDNVLVNFPLVPGQRSGVFATEDYYIRPVDKGQMRNPGNVLVNSHPGYKSESVFDYYVLAGALWDPHGTWGPAGNYFVYDSPFFTYGQAVTPVEPAGDTGGVSVPGPFYGLLEFVINNERLYYEATMALEATRLDPNTLAPIGTWTVAESQPGWLLYNMRHFAAHRDGIYTLEFPGATIPTDLEVRFENMLEETDTLLLGLQYSGAVAPNAVYVQSSGNFRVYTEEANLDDVRNSAGETWYQDEANDMIWVKLRGGSWAFWDNTGLEAIPTSDELLYETTVLHVNTD